MPAQPSDQQKFVFLMKVYFGTSDNPTDDVNPFTSLEEFAQAKVGDLRWGIDSEARRRSKLRFAFNYHKVLEHFKVLLSIDDICNALVDDKINKAAVEIWVKKADFI